jgi:hypothetical protein
VEAIGETRFANLESAWELCQYPAVNELKASVIMNIDRTYDIFRKTSNKDAVWLEAVQGLRQAKKRLLHYNSTSTGEYLVFDATEAKFIDVWDEAESA